MHARPLIFASLILCLILALVATPTNAWAVEAAPTAGDPTGTGQIDGGDTTTDDADAATGGGDVDFTDDEAADAFFDSNPELGLAVEAARGSDAYRAYTAPANPVAGLQTKPVEAPPADSELPRVDLEPQQQDAPAPTTFADPGGEDRIEDIAPYSEPQSISDPFPMRGALGLLIIGAVILSIVVWAVRASRPVEPVRPYPADHYLSDPPDPDPLIDEANDFYESQTTTSHLLDKIR